MKIVEPSKVGWEKLDPVGSISFVFLIEEEKRSFFLNHVSSLLD